MDKTCSKCGIGARYVTKNGYTDSWCLSCRRASRAGIRTVAQKFSYHYLSSLACRPKAQRDE